jgi:hypothetical protein
VDAADDDSLRGHIETVEVTATTSPVIHAVTVVAVIKTVALKKERLGQRTSLGKKEDQVRLTHSDKFLNS